MNTVLKTAYKIIILNDNHWTNWCCYKSL